jgi:GT2 family glycosyltransferase
VFRNSALLDAGGYDEAMRTNGEDAEICRQLKSHGWRLIYDPNALATYLRHDTITSILNAYWRWTFYGFRNPLDRLTLPTILRRAFLGNVRYTFGHLAWSDLILRFNI